MTDSIRVFINGTVADLRPGSNVADALGAMDRSLAEKLAEGVAYVTDGRGIELDPGTPLANGAILRVVVRAKRGIADVDP
jgi:hypothetical protein